VAALSTATTTTTRPEQPRPPAAFHGEVVATLVFEVEAEAGRHRWLPRTD